MFFDLAKIARDPQEQESVRCWVWFDRACWFTAGAIATIALFTAVVVAHG
jgi:hypothetical protein